MTPAPLTAWMIAAWGWRGALWGLASLHFLVCLPIHAVLLRDAPDGPFGTMILWERAIAEGRLFGAAFTGQWFEVGEPHAIKPTEEALRGA